MTSKAKKTGASNKSYLTLGGIVLVAVLLAVGIAAHFKYHRSGSETVAAEQGIHVSLGGMEYTLSDDRAVKRTDKTVTELRKFLVDTAKEDISANCEAVYYNVMAVTEAEDQILLNYGCSYPNARMFAVKRDDQWKFISPTNQFDHLGIPECAYVEKHTIEATIAPVCVTGMNDESATEVSYHTRL